MVEPMRLHDPSGYLQIALDEGGGPATAVTSALTAVAWGEDEQGVVRTAVDGEGRVVAVALDPHWRSALKDHELGELVCSAVRNAAEARAAGRLAPVPPDARSPLPAPNEPPPVAPPRSAPEAMRWLGDLVHDVMSSLDQIRLAAEQAAAEEIEGRSSCGRVVARARAGSLVSVECSLQLQREGSREQVERALAEALARALPGQLHHVHAAVRNTGRVGELLALTSDPSRLLTMLGLPTTAGPGWRGPAGANGPGATPTIGRGE